VAVTQPARRQRAVRREAVENRERLLHAAKHVFAVKGVDAPVEDIARAAGLGMGTLYRHFPTKQALIDELVGQLRLNLLSLARRACRRDSADGLESFLYDAGKAHVREPGYMQFLWSRSSKEQAAVEEVLQALDLLLDRAKTAGRVRPDLAVTDVWMTLWSLRGIIEITVDVAPAAWKRHLQLMIAGMLAQPTPRLTATPLSNSQARQAISRASR
jgi:AcrR family transcriptional regulator